MIQKHLEALLSQDLHRLTEIIVQESEREFVSDICAAYNYCAVFSLPQQGYVSFIAIKLSDPC